MGLAPLVILRSIAISSKHEKLSKFLRRLQLVLEMQLEQLLHYIRSDLIIEVRNRLSLVACSARSANSMDVGLGVSREVEIDDVADIANIKSSRSDVRSY